MENQYRVVDCCMEMVKHLGKDDPLSYAENDPCNAVREGPTVYIMSHSGFAGTVRIRYCPFCGKQITFCALGD